MIELSAPNPPADEAHVVTAEQIHDPIGGGGVTHHKNDLTVGPHTNVHEALDQQQHTCHERNIQDRIAKVEDEAKPQVRDDHQEIHAGIQAPQLKHSPQRWLTGAVSLHTTTSFRG